MAHIAQCPSCATRFRVVPDQLKISQGWVRCGKCSAIFDARAHLLDPHHPPSAPAPTPAPTIPPGPVAVMLRQLADEPARPPAPAAPSPTAPAPSPSPSSLPLSLAKPPAEPATAPFASAAPAHAPVADPSTSPAPGRLPAAPAVPTPQPPAAAAWEEAEAPAIPRFLLQRPPEPTPGPFSSQPTPPHAEAPRSAHTLASAAGGAHPSQLVAQTAPPLAPPASDAPQSAAPAAQAAFDPAAPREPAPMPPAASGPATGTAIAPATPAQTPADTAAAVLPPSAAAKAPPAGPAPAAEIAPAAQPAPAPAPAHAPVSAAQTAPAALPTVGFLRQARRRAFWQRQSVRVLLAVLGVVLSVGLAVQVAVHERNRLAARWPALRPVLTELCQPLGCRIEPWQRIEALHIAGSELARRSDGAHRFQVVLRNRENLPVATPAVELALTDRSGQTVARRVLLPGDWPEAPAELPPAAETTLQVLLRWDQSLRTEGFRTEIFYP